MSVTSLSSLRARKEDYRVQMEAHAVSGGTTTDPEVAQNLPADGQQPPPPPVPPPAPPPEQPFVDQLVSLIPGESLAFFVAALGIAGADASTTTKSILLGVTLVLTVGWTKINYMRKAKTKEAKAVWPKFEMFLATVATLAWSTTVPSNPWTAIEGFKTQHGVLIAVVASALLVMLKAWRDARNEVP